MDEQIRAINADLEAAQAKLWDLKHTAPLADRDNETVRHIISGVDAMSRQLTSYQQWIGSLPHGK